MGIRRMVVLAALGGTALFALSPSSASVGAGTGQITKQSGWVTIASPKPGVHVQRKTINVSGYKGARTVTRVTWPIGNSYHPTAAGHQDGYLPVFSAAASKAGQ